MLFTLDLYINVFAKDIAMKMLTEINHRALYLENIVIGNLMQIQHANRMFVIKTVL